MNRFNDRKNDILLDTFEAISKYGVVRHERKYRIRRWGVGLSALVGSFAVAGVLSGNGDEMVDGVKSAAKIVAETGENITEQFEDTVCTGTQVFDAKEGSTIYDFAQLVEHGPEVPVQDVVHEIIELNRTNDDKTDSDVISIYPGQKIYTPVECFKGDPNDN